MPSIRAQQPTAVASTSRTAAAGTAKKAAFDIKPQSADPGIKFTVDPSGKSVTVRGTAKGPKVVKTADGQDVRYEVSRGVSLSLDRKSMPNFDNEPNYTKKNAWYFAHTPSLGTRAGQSAKEVAQALAEKINAGGAYRATVSAKADGSATITLAKP
jgi:hypothetical protein